MLNKRIVTGFMSIAGALAIAGGATFAYFTDTVSSTGNSFAAGSLDINLRSEGGSAPFNVTGMMPGESVKRYVTVVNDGSEDMQWRAYISGGNGGALFGALRVTSIKMKPTDFTGYTALESAGYTVAGPDNYEILTSGPATFNDLLTPNNGILEWDDDNPSTEDPFKSKWAAVYEVTVQMDPNADNSYNGTSWMGDLKFDAYQTDDDSVM